MEQFKKNAITVQAEIFDGSPEQLMNLEAQGLQYKTYDNQRIGIKSGNTYEDVEVGDYIVMDIEGKFIVMKPERFRKTYSSMNEESNQPGTSAINPSYIENSNPVEEINSDFTEDKVSTQNLNRTMMIGFISVSLVVIIFGLTNIFLYKSNIQKIVEEANKTAIEKASNELLAQTQIEALQIIEKAKADAKEEAEQTFRNEMKRLTEEKLGK